MAGNRSFGNGQGRLIVNNTANDCTINVISNLNRFYNNGAGTNIFAGLGTAQPANGNTINYASFGDQYIDNTGFSEFDLGGLIIGGGENIAVPYNANNNTVVARLWGNRFSGNQVADIQVYGAKSLPESAGIPGLNNSATVFLVGTRPGSYTQLVVQSTPEEPMNSNTATLIH